ncbi:DUF2889 domain-containing protein [Arhodomonas sp. SL1]|uniref:DUF2889 domain-containing protein n=1 Tax=Arhodomonas sp. SL1 TaxID=3425691 RepID=UPI003F8816E4
MSLPEPRPRRRLHRRRIVLDGYRREDGLWEVEAALVDTKTQPFELQFRGELAPGEHIHDMALRVALDDDLTIREAAASMDATPFPDCPGAEQAYRALVGVQIGPGWIKAVNERIGRTAGCTHLFELLRPIATTAYQMIYPARDRGSETPVLLDTCHGWRAGGQAISTLYPEWFRPESE